jgi:hypothetical protein
MHACMFFIQFTREPVDDWMTVRSATVLIGNDRWITSAVAKFILRGVLSYLSIRAALFTSIPTTLDSAKEYFTSCTI